MSEQEKQNLITLGTISFLGKYDKDAAYNWAFNVENPIVTYKGASYIAIDQPEVGQLPDENPKVWQLLGKFEGGGASLDFELPLRLDKSTVELVYDEIFFQKYTPDSRLKIINGIKKLVKNVPDDYEPETGALTWSSEILEALNEKLDELETQANAAQETADEAFKSAADAAILAKAAIKTLNAKTTDTVKMTAKANGDGSVDLSAELINPSPTPSKLALYDFYNPAIIEYDTNIIPSIKNLQAKKPFPGKKIYITMPKLLDSFYNPNDLLIVCVNYGVFDTSKWGSQEKLRLGANCISYRRLYTASMDKTKLRYEDDYIAFTFDATKIIADMSLANKNQVLITVSSSKYTDSGYVDTFDANIEDEGTTSWKKNNTLGCGILTTGAVSLYKYDSRIYHNYTDTNSAVLNLSLPRNAFDSNWIKTLIFIDTSIESVKSDHNVIVSIMAQDKEISNPYSINTKDSVKFIVPVYKIDVAKRVTLQCINNQVFIS